MVTQAQERDSLYNSDGIMGNINKQLALQPKTLTDWLATTSGSQRTAQYGYFGPGALLRKDITSAGDTMIATDFFTNTFGAKVWDSLNSQTKTFNLLRKVGWGNTTGWRVRSGRNLSTRGVGETAALPTIDTPDLERIAMPPSFIVTSLGVSALAQFLGTVEGGIGDALAVAQETAETDHLKKINQMTLAPSEIRVAAAGTATTATLVTSGGNYVSEGDSFFRSDQAGSANYITITEKAGDLITYVATGNQSGLAADAVLYTRSRGGVWSLADIVDEDGRTVAGQTLTDAGPLYASIGHGARDTGQWNAAGYISSNAGVLRQLTTGHLDSVIQEIRINGFEPDLLLTGVEQETRLGTILQANQHFIGEGKFQVKQGGEATLPGYETGFEVSTYKKIPLFTDADMTPSWQLPGNGDLKRGSDVYALDTRFLELPVLWTTQYMESRDYIHNNYLGIKAIFLSAFNFRCLNFRAQGRVTDLSDGTNLA